MPSFLTDFLGVLGAIGLVLASLLVTVLLVFFIAFFLPLHWKRMNRSTPRRFKAPKRPQKRFAIHQYIKYVGPQLRQRYGSQKTYTPNQVKQTVKNSGYGSDYDCYAYAMYCSHDDFIYYHSTIGESCDYYSMRSEIADSFSSVFAGDTTFDAGHVIDMSDQISPAETTSVSSSDSWWSSPSDFGGSDYSSGGSDYSSGGSDYSSSSSDYSSGGSDYSSSGGDY